MKILDRSESWSYSKECSSLTTADRKKPVCVHFGPELVCVCVYHQDIFTSSGMLLETVVLPLAVSYLSQKQT